MKKKVLIALSYIATAMVTCGLTIFLIQRQIPSTKLITLENLILELFPNEVDRTEMEDAAADAMVAALGDRWSYYIPASEYESYREQSENAYVGVGITIQVTGDNSGFLVQEVAAGGPAEEAGLQVLDLLIAVEETDIRGMELSEVAGLVKGKENTYVNLTVLRQGEAVSMDVQRRKVQTPVATYEMLPDNIGFIAIENFDDRCTEETVAAIEALLEAGAEKLVFDVRYNPGGYAHELVNLLDYLLPEGDLFRTVRYDGKEQVDTSDADCLEIPMAVLVNESSYSAAEFFAAALQEYGAGIVVGEKTVGKGYFQTTHRLADGSAVSLSTGKYFTPNGVSLAETGVTPDIIVPVDEETAAGIYYGLLERSEDPQLQAAVEHLKN